MFTHNDRVSLQMTVEKWGRSAPNEEYKWKGDLADPDPNEEGVYEYEVKEGVWIEVCVRNMASASVSIQLLRTQQCRFGMDDSYKREVTLNPQESYRMNEFRVEGQVTNVKVNDEDGQTLLNLQFKTVAAPYGWTRSSSGKWVLDCLLAQLLDAR